LHRAGCGAAEADAGEGDANLAIRVELASGMTIRVDAGVDAAELVRLVEALSGMGC